jgi:hypothetical protein
MVSSARGQTYHSPPVKVALPIILASAFFFLRLLKLISRLLAKEEYPLINRVIAKKSTA